ncbi:MAG TPA: BON domain-containing protein [Burkholderiaceae bacterium]|nr:BON domain-containing protein [Burkholderiaceae bacterium]
MPNPQQRSRGRTPFERGGDDRSHPSEPDIAPERRGQSNEQRSGFELSADDEGGYGTQDYSLGPRGGYGHEAFGAGQASYSGRGGGGSGYGGYRDELQYVDQDFGKRGWQEPERYHRASEERQERSFGAEDDDYRASYGGGDAYIGQRRRDASAASARESSSRSHGDQQSGRERYSGVQGTQQGYGGVSYERGSNERPLGDQYREAMPRPAPMPGSRASLRGRAGPKGYQRSDERLREEICERLLHEHRVDVEDVSVRVESARVTLEGSVPERRMRYLIEDIVDDVHGVQDIENHLRVGRSSTAPSVTQEQQRVSTQASPSSDVIRSSMTGGPGGETTAAGSSADRSTSGGVSLHGSEGSGTPFAKESSSSSGESQTSIGSGASAASNGGGASSASNGTGIGNK